MESNELQLLKEAETLQKKPRLLIPLKEMEKILAWTLKSPGEINGLGLVEKRHNDFWLQQAFILKLKADKASATIDPLAFNKYVAECDDPSKIRFQWHSHGDISANFFSDTDLQCTIAKWTGEYLISLVLNKRGEYRCRLDIFDPAYFGFELPIFIAIEAEKEILDFCQKEITEKVQFPGWRGKRTAAWKDGAHALALPLGNFQLFSQEEQ